MFVKPFNFIVYKMDLSTFRVSCPAMLWPPPCVQFLYGMPCFDIITGNQFFNQVVGNQQQYEKWWKDLESRKSFSWHLSE